MRYLPLTPADRQQMLAAIGAQSIDDLFVDVPAAAQLDGPVHGLPSHAAPGTTLEADVRGKRVPLTVTPMPFIPNNYHRRGAAK